MKRVSIDSVTSGTSVRVGGAHRGGWQGAPRASVTSAQVAQVTIVTSYDSATTLQVIILSREAIPRSYTHAKMAILPKRYILSDPRLHQPHTAPQKSDLTSAPRGRGQRPQLGVYRVLV